MHWLKYQPHFCCVAKIRAGNKKVGNVESMIESAVLTEPVVCITRYHKSPQLFINCAS